MITNNLVITEKGLMAIVMAAFAPASQEAIHAKIATRATSTAKDEKYGWLGANPAVQEWLDERQPTGLEDHEFTITNKHFETSLAIDRNALEDDQLGGLRERVSQLGVKIANHPTKLAADLKNNNTELCYDGKVLYASDHQSEEETAQSNLITQTGLTEANIRTDLEKAWNYFFNLKDAKGDPFWGPGEVKLMVHCCPKNALTIQKALQLDIQTQGDNIFKNVITGIVVDPFLTNNDTIYVENVGGVVRSIIWQERQAPRSSMDEKWSSRFTNFGVDSRFNVACGLWQATCKIS